MPRRPAFTLIELLIVIAIIGILATLVITQTGDSNRKARNASAQSDIAQMGKAVESFRIEDTASGQVVSDLPGTTDQQGGGQSTLASIFTGTQNIGALTYAAAVSKTPGPPYIYRYVASGTPTVASGVTARQLVKGSPGLPAYSLCTTLVGAVTPYFCASDSGGGGQSSLDQVAASQGAGNISAAAANGLMAWYKLDGAGTSVTATDSSSNGNDGMLANFTFDGTTNGWVPGKFGNALQFNGSNGYTTLANVSFNQPITLTTWFNETARSGWKTILSIGGNSIHLNPQGNPTYSGLGCPIYDCQTSTVFTYGVWHQITVSINTVNLQIYFDGSQVGTWSASAYSAFSAPGLLGARGGGVEYFNGSIDDTRIYNRVLTSGEIQQLYQGTL